MREADLTIVDVACSISNTLFVCDDESMYAIGDCHTYEKRWNDAYSQSKTWSKISKDPECTDFAKVDASGSCRVILTKCNQLFCQGENLRLYIDSDVDHNKLAKDFINCTEVFPVEDGD